jgi:hypothetical protein
MTGTEPFAQRERLPEEQVAWLLGLADDRRAALRDRPLVQVSVYRSGRVQIEPHPDTDADDVKPLLVEVLRHLTESG